MGTDLPPSTQFNLDKRLLSKLGRTFCQPFSDLSLSGKLTLEHWRMPLQKGQNEYWIREKERSKSTDQVCAKWTDTHLLSPNHSYLQQHNRVFYCNILSKVRAAQTPGWPVSTPISKPPNSTLNRESTGETESCSVISDSLWPRVLYRPWNSPGQNIGVCSLSLLQVIIPTQGSNLSLPYCRRILYQLSHKGSPRILEWVAYPFSSGPSQPRNQTGVSCTAGAWATREAPTRSLSTEKAQMNETANWAVTSPLHADLYEWFWTSCLGWPKPQFPEIIIKSNAKITLYSNIQISVWSGKWFVMMPYYVSGSALWEEEQTFSS